MEVENLIIALIKRPSEATGLRIVEWKFIFSISPHGRALDGKKKKNNNKIIIK